MEGGKKAPQKKKDSRLESHFWAAAQYLSGSVAVCLFCLILKELFSPYFLGDESVVRANREGDIHAACDVFG